MAILVTPERFCGREQAVAAIEADGLFHAEATVAVRAMNAVLHTHPYHIEIYMLEGVLDLHESETGLVHRLTPGTRAVVPPNTLHAESGPGPIRAVFGLSEDPATIDAAGDVGEG